MSAPLPQLTIHAPAKLNLALAVGPPGADGMHPICSWMITVDLHDELHLRRLELGGLSRYAVLWHEEARRRSEIDWSITRDLAARAHLALERRLGRALPVQVRVEKRIPVGAGLGGGSSDAAAMLRGLNHLFDLQLDDATLREIGAELGSDVPFLVQGGSAIISGLGERADHHDQPHPVHAVLIMPEHGAGTREVYQTLDAQRESGEHAYASGSFAQDAQRVAQFPHHVRSAQRIDASMLFNDLAQPACAVLPELRELIRAVEAIAELPAHITGSGSTIFVVCDDPMHAQALADALEERIEVSALAVQSSTLEEPVIHQDEAHYS